MTRRPAGMGVAPVGTARWPALGAFAVLVACTQLLWLSCAPVTTRAATALGVSEGAIGDLAVLNPILFVALGLPAGRWIDRRFTGTLALGAILVAAGAVLRAAVPSSYAVVFAGQLVLSAGQPLVLAATTKVAARWFPPGERTTAIAVASAAQFVGILAAAGTVAPLEARGGLRLVLVVHAAVAVVSVLGVLAALQVPAAYAAGSAAEVSLRWLRHDRFVWLLAGLLFIGVGVFNALATWLDPILTDLGHRGAGGPTILAMTVAGIVGSAVLPDLVARRDRRRTLLLTTIVVTAATFPLVALLAGLPGVVAVVVPLTVAGFVLLAALPVTLDWSELEAGPARAGTATGLLMLAGNLGGAVLVLVVQALIGHPRAALVALGLLTLPGLELARRLPAHAGSHTDDERSAPVEATG